MKRTFLHAVGFGFAFVVANLVLIAAWAASQRATLRMHLADLGQADARAVLAFAAERPTDALVHDLTVRSHLEDLVKGRGMVGVVVLGADRKVIARAGDLSAETLAAIDAGSPRRDGDMVDGAMLFREVQSPLVAIAVEPIDRADAPWASVRRRATWAALAAVLFAPIFGYLLARYLATRA